MIMVFGSVTLPMPKKKRFVYAVDVDRVCVLFLFWLVHRKNDIIVLAGLDYGSSFSCFLGQNMLGR